MKLVLLLVILLLSCSPKPEIKLETIKKHMNMLASDEMKGRDSFSPEITKAEDYIVSVYKEAGLKAFDKYPNFTHSFSLYKYTVNTDESAVKVNNKVLNNVIFSAEKSAVLSSLDGFDVKSFTKKDNIRSLFGMLRSPEKNLFVWLDPAHENSFKRLQYYFSNGKVTNENPSERIIIIALTKKKKVSNISITLNVDTKETKVRNTIGYIEGSDLKDEYVLFGAHHDHIGMKKNAEEGEDNIYNGANDNATGTSAVLTLAKFYSELKSNKRSLIFSTFTAEEKGLIGSTELAKNFPVDLENIKMMINIEMLGQETDWGKRSVFMTGYERSNMGQIMNESANDSAFIYVHPDPYKQMNLFYRSDNAAFARESVLAHTISSTSMKAQPNTYHQLNDDLDHIDYENMRDLIEGITKLSRTMISGEKTPEFYPEFKNKKD